MEDKRKIPPITSKEIEMLDTQKKYDVDIFDSYMNNKPKEYPMWTFNESGTLVKVDNKEVDSNINIFGE